MQDLERVQGRLDRIGAIQPVLAALRTISLASWRTALRERDNVRLFAGGLERAARQLPPASRHGPSVRKTIRRQDRADEHPIRRAVLVIGSERGLCGRFNLAAVERAEELMDSGWQDQPSAEVMALGSRTAGMLGRRGHQPDWEAKLTLTSLPPYALADALTTEWLSRLERGSLDELHVVYNEYEGLGRYRPRSVCLIPVASLTPDGEGLEVPDPEPIIETDPGGIRERLESLLTAATLHEMLISSAAAEHSTRYQLMDGASQNSERIIEELTLEVQIARQQAVTRDMQELAIGAGLLGTQAE